MGETGRLRSRELSGRWEISIEDRVTRSYRLQASLATLRRPLRPCRVSFAGRRLPRSAWSFSPATAVLVARFRGRAGTLVADRC
jgi:hypothetical protein